MTIRPLPPELRLPEDVMNADMPIAETIFRENFGTDFAKFASRTYVIGVAPDGAFVGMSFRLPSGDVVNVSIRAGEFENFVNVLLASWQICADKAAVKGEPQGNA